MNVEESVEYYLRGWFMISYAKALDTSGRRIIGAKPN